jgi:hypothetical protein
LEGSSFGGGDWGSWDDSLDDDTNLGISGAEPIEMGMGLNWNNGSSSSSSSSATSSAQGSSSANFASRSSDRRPSYIQQPIRPSLRTNTLREMESFDSALSPSETDEIDVLLDPQPGTKP